MKREGLEFVCEWKSELFDKELRLQIYFIKIFLINIARSVCTQHNPATIVQLETKRINSLRFSMETYGHAERRNGSGMRFMKMNKHITKIKSAYSSINKSF